MTRERLDTAAGEGPDVAAGLTDWRARSAVALELREAQGVGRPYRYLEGRAVPYDTYADVGFYLEQHAAGSFNRSTKGGAGKTAPLLLFHDNRSMPIGHAEKWTYDADGLLGLWRLNDTTEAQQAATLAAGGDLVGLSVGFVPIRSTWELADDWALDLGPDHMDRVTRQESRLVEVSMTPTPVFEAAGVVEVREAAGVYTRARSSYAPEPATEAWRRELDRLRSGPNA